MISEALFMLTLYLLLEQTELVKRCREADMHAMIAISGFIPILMQHKTSELLR